MSACAMFVLNAPPPASSFPCGNTTRRISHGRLVIENSSRPQKKATAHHRKTRPKKTQPWDVKRGPAVYPPLPDMPPEWTLVTDHTAAAAAAATTSVVAEAETVPA